MRCASQPSKTRWGVISAPAIPTRTSGTGSTPASTWPVSGVILWAKTAKAARRMAEQFAAGAKSLKSIGRWWRASRSTRWARGKIGSAPTKRGRAARPRSACPHAPRSRRGGRSLRFQIARARRLPESAAWLRLWPETGRTHQLRVQSSTRKLPILGDSAYGAAESWPEGIALHAAVLRVRHPVSGEQLEVHALSVPELVGAAEGSSWARKSHAEREDHRRRLVGRPRDRAAGAVPPAGERGA